MAARTSLLSYVFWFILSIRSMIVNGANHAGASASALPTCSQAVLNALVADDAREIERFGIIGENMECMEPKLREPILISAIKARSVSIASVLIQQLTKGDPQVDERDQRGSTPLHLCAFLGLSDLMKHLLDRGADPTIVDAFNKTALHLGAAWQNVTELLLSLPSKPLRSLLRSHDVDGNTALHLALTQNFEASARMIMTSSEDYMLQFRNGAGETPLHLCVTVDIARTLAKRGVNLTARDDSGAVPLHTVAGRTGSVEVLSFLVAEGGGPISVRDKKNATPLHYACEAGVSANVKWLIDNGVDVEVVDSEGNIALMRGMRQGYLYLVKLFTTGEGSTPLHAAVEINRLDVLKALVKDEGLDVNIPDTRTGQSAIFPAASAGLLEIVGYLVDQQADLKTLDNTGWSVLGTAIRSGQPAVAKLLLERGANASQSNRGKRTALHEASQRGDRMTVTELLKRKVFIDAQDHLMRTALHVAAQSAPEIVDILLGNGAQELPMRDGRMPLHIAAGEGGQKDAAEHLLRGRHNVNAREYQGDSPLIVASLHGHTDIVQLLLVWCADVHAQNSFQRIASDYSQNSETTELLENAGVMKGRCQCDCGPYNPGVQYRVFGWSGGCTGMVMCMTGDGVKRELFTCQAPSTEEASNAEDVTEANAPTLGASAELDSSSAPGRWVPPVPGLNCPTAISHAESMQHLSWSLFLLICTVRVIPGHGA